MRTLFSLLFLVFAFFLAFLLYKSIEEPIAFNNERSVRDQAVADKLQMIRKAQELYRDITGEFAPTFDTLKQVLTEGELLSISVIGDPDDPNFTGTITYDTTRIPARDTIAGLGIVLEDIEKVPYTEGVNFDIDAKVIEYQSTQVPVVQVGVKKATYMGEYGDIKYQRYDQNYNPNAAMSFGDLSKPTLGGSWQ
ncbi:hypothetical protein QWY85_10330 [Neolewinella lacunae]|uniref:Uncharacterized protein n=1 Tax=Neolewinella lacunae TaxID=1517758 RepID=A0A923PJW0_9BACT|nr:hypothetical protein [Neolewinella lacunae]MBC6995468.1 hypothetical protein [Neolewinella lacunae]MDN3635056.1 hypothetical protein [Neolewinella lacunae]